MAFLSLTSRSRKAADFLHELISWSRVSLQTHQKQSGVLNALHFQLSSKESCLQQSIFAIETSEFLLNAGNFQAASDLQFYLIALLVPLTENCFDPRPVLNCVLKSMRLCRQKDVNSQSFSSLLLVSLANLLHTVSPFYLVDILTVIKVMARLSSHLFAFSSFFFQDVVDNEKSGNPLIYKMIVDSLAVQLASVSRLLSSENVQEIHETIRLLTETPWEQRKGRAKLDRCLKYFDPKIASSFNTMALTDHLCESTEFLNSFLERRNVNEILCKELFLLFRVLIGGEALDLRDDEWSRILSFLMIHVRNNEAISMDTFYFMLRLLAREENGKRQAALLRELAGFATVKV